ncbi:nuclear transport factor 2 family protein [Gemmatimonas sp.]|uniref:nuclear transport factor 2 family protein n=1 Tax=Gemmatimonas sp. TaxID=1962908 RepID=UPI00356448F1
MSDTNEIRLAKLEAAEEIRALKVAYAAACDAGFQADVLADLFTDDAVWSTERFGTFSGRDRIRAFFEEVSLTITWAKHFMVGHTVHVHDDVSTARGTCELLELCVIDGQTVLLTGRYEDTYRKAGGRWRHATVDLAMTDVGLLLPHSDTPVMPTESASSE